MFFSKLYGKLQQAAGKLDNVCKNPLRVVLFFAVVLTLFYTVQCALLQNVLGLDVLETIIWGAQGGWGHAKHPPLSGFLGYLIADLSGHRDWAMYLAAQMCLAIGVFFTYQTARLFVNKFAAGSAAIFLYTLFYYNPSETRFCTYPLEMALVPIAVYLFFKAMQCHKLIFYVLLGAVSALGILNKYSFGLFLAAMLLIFMLTPEYRRQLKSYKPYLTAVVMIVLLIPHLNWLIEHDFICFKHVSGRLTSEHSWTDPLVTLVTALYPAAMAALVLLLAILPDHKTRPLTEPSPILFRNMLLLSIVPPGVLVLLALAGTSIIMMWMCSMGAFVFLMLLGKFKWEIDVVFFRRVVLWAGLYSVIIMSATTLDLAFSSRPRLHSQPENYTLPARELWHRHSPQPIPVVVGTRFEAAVLSNYLPNHPGACEVNDPVYLEHYQDTIREKGALLVGKKNSFNDFFQTMDVDPASVTLQKITYPYRARFGRKRMRTYFLGYLPPQKKSAEKNIKQDKSN